MAVHYVENTYQCSHCYRPFSTNTDLTKHMSICEISFQNTSGLGKPIELHTLDDVIQPIGVICDDSIASNATLKQDMSHKGDKTFQGDKSFTE